MGTDVAEVVETLPPVHSLKVHRQMCTELMKLLDRVIEIFPEIEAARPGCSSGMQALCLLNSAIEKAKSQLQYCSDSSKLYLAITGDVILSRCRKARNLLVQSLSQIQSLVPVMLAAEISRIIPDLTDATFSLDPFEEEAGKVMKTLLLQYSSSATDSIEESAIESIRIAASRLHITSRKAILIERRSIKKLLDKVSDDALSKKRILLFLLNLLGKYEKSIVRGQKENACVGHENSLSSRSSCDQSVKIESRIEHGLDEAQVDSLSKLTLLDEFRCPLSSRLMYDPVVIDSGQTFERMWIQKWFDEGHDTCPKTKRKLAHLSLTPNSALKDLISKWCMRNGITVLNPFSRSDTVHSWESSATSIASLSSSMNNLRLPIDYSNVSLGSLDSSQISDSSIVKTPDCTEYMPMKIGADSHALLSSANKHSRDIESFHKLDALPWESQCKMVEDIKNYFKHDAHGVQLASLEKIVEPLVKFLTQAANLNDAKAQRTGCLLLLAFVTKCRSSIPYLNESAYDLLASFLDSEVTEEALSIVEVLSYDQPCRSKIAASGAITSILHILELRVRELQEPAIRILYNLSLSSDIHSNIVPSEFISKLVPYFEDNTLARYCIAILKILCDKEDARAYVAETGGCIPAIAKLLEMDSRECQEHAVAILLSLCSQRDQYCHLVMHEGVIPALFSISINGNDKGKASAMELLRILKDIEYDGTQECPAFDHDFSRESSNHSKEQKSVSKPLGLFKKMPKFLALKRRR